MKRLIVLGLVVALVTVMSAPAALFAMGGGGGGNGGCDKNRNGLTASSKCEYPKKKVTICHKGKTIRVGENAAAAHLRNHKQDHPGPCKKDNGNHHGNHHGNHDD